MNRIVERLLSMAVIFFIALVPATVAAQEEAAPAAPGAGAPAAQDAAATSGQESAAAGQEASAAGPVTDGEGMHKVLGEITVTAQKRSESMQDVAVSMSALDELMLDDLGVSNFEDLARSIATLNFSSNGPNKFKIIVRGLSEGAPTESDYQVQSTVSIYIDETPITSAVATPDFHVLDLARIELLRGPQGTLYGAGSMGGTFKMVTNKPDLGKFGGKIDATYGSVSGGDQDYQLGLVLNIPMGEKNALRLVGYKKYDGGYIENTALGLEDWNTVDTTGVRLSWRFQPTEHLNLVTSYMHQEADVEGRNRYEPELGDLLFYGPIFETQNDTVDLFNFELDYDGWGFADLVSSTSFYEGVNDFVFDWSAVGFIAAEPLFVFTQTEPIVWQNIDQTFSVFAQEIRLVSKGDGPFTWTAGVFYSNEETSYDQWVWADQLERLMSITPLGPESVQPGGVAYLGDDVIFFGVNKHNVDQLALFGELSYDFGAKWTGTVGARWFQVDMENEPISYGAQNMITGVANTAAIQRLIDAGIDPTPEAVFMEVISSTGQVGGSPTSDTDDGVNPRFGLEFRPSDRVLTYGLVSKGYRIGGVNSGLSAGLGAPPTYGPDSLWNYELGVKTTLAGGRATLNGALYYLDWSDIISVAGIQGFRYRINGGKASVTGAELDFQMVMTQNWSFRAGINYSDSQLGENICADFISGEPCTEDSPDLIGRTGDQLIMAPKLSYGAALQYDGRLSSTLNWRALLDFQHVGQSYDRYESMPNAQVVGDYDTINLRFSVLAHQGWEVSLFGRNLTDERGILATQFIQGNFAPIEFFRWHVIRPRTIGLNIRYHF
jgi:iron complex outermembrane receptor protein